MVDRLATVSSIVSREFKFQQTNQQYLFGIPDEREEQTLASPELLTRSSLISQLPLPQRWSSNLGFVFSKAWVWVMV
jgi:hypothetical protein